MQANLTNFTNNKFYFLPLIKTVSADVVLGNPQMSCAGHGICKVLSLPNKFAFNCQKIKVLISKIDKTTILFSFERKAMCPCLEKKHFRTSYFIMTEAYELPSWLKEKLDIDGDKYIKKGQYFIQKNHDDYQVCFFINGR